MGSMDLSIFGAYEPVVVVFLVSVLVMLGWWVYTDAAARGDDFAPYWAGSIVVTSLTSASLFPPAFLLGAVLLVSYRATHSRSVRLARMNAADQP